MRGWSAGRGPSADGAFARELRSLARELPGQVTRPGDTVYDLARSGWNLFVDQRPEAVVLPRSTDDVARAVRSAAAHGVPVGVQATGHGTLRPADGALLLNTSRMNEVTVDPDTRTAWVGAGTRFEKLARLAEPYGLAPAAAQEPMLGVVGTSLSGGCGWLVRRYGLAADALVAAEVVTPDGKRHHVDADHEPELLWALRGGGGGVGVVTAARVELFPVAGALCGELYFPGPMAREVLRAWRDVTEHAPAELTSQVTLQNLPARVPYVGVPTLVQGRETVAVGACLVAPEAAGLPRLERRMDDLLGPLRALRPILDTVGPRPLSALAGFTGSAVGPQRPWGRTEMFAELPNAAIDTLLVHAGPGTESPLTAVTFRHVGGRQQEPRTEGSVLRERQATYLMQVLTLCREPEPDGWVRLRTVEVAVAMQRWATGAVLPTFLLPGEEEGRVRAAYPPGQLSRIARIRSEVDPDGLLRVAQPLE